MIPARTLMSISRRDSEIADSQPRPLISVVLLTRLPHTEEESKMLVSRFGSQRPQVEIIVVIEPSPFSETLRFASWCSERGCRVIQHDSPCGLPNLRLDEGILASRGRWLWLLDSQNHIPAIDLGLIIDILRGLSDESDPLVLIHPKDEKKHGLVSGKDPNWIDMLYKGWQFPLENFFFPRSLFDTYGLLDPHIVMSQFFQQEFLIRICRFVQFKKICKRAVTRGCSVMQQHRFPRIFYYWIDIDRRRHLVLERIAHYVVDDLEQFKNAVPRSELWNAYLGYVLPYYYDFRHILGEGFPEIVQSVPPRANHVLCVKGDYETSVESTVRNFDIFSQARRSFKLSYIHIGQLDLDRDISDDAIILLRTADDYSLALAKEAIRRGLPVGYALDDDLLNFSQYGGDFASFRAGHPAYDAMVNTMKLVDVVLCGGPYVEKAVQAHNQRTCHFEGSILPQFLPEGEAKIKSEPFRFAYAGGGYRLEEITMIWPAIERICQEYSDRVHFEFWGIDPDRLPRNLKQVSFVPFSHSYFEYLARLRVAKFDAMLVPLFYNPAPRRGKLPCKLFETAAAGAVGLFSDVPTYHVVKRNKLGIVVNENMESWYEAMRRVLEMKEEEYTSLQARCLSFVREFYTTPAMLPIHEQGLQAVFLHGATREARGSDGRPHIMYVFCSIDGTAGGVIQFKRRIELAMKAGICPVVVISLAGSIGESIKDDVNGILIAGSKPDQIAKAVIMLVAHAPNDRKVTNELISFLQYLEANNISYDFAHYAVFTVTPAGNVLPHPEEERSVRDLLSRHTVALVHSVGFIPAIGKICSEMDIPHVVSAYGVDDAYKWPNNRLPFRHCDLVQSDTIRYAKRWGKLFESQWFCAREIVPESLFETGFERLYGGLRQSNRGQVTRLGIVGTLMPRKSQLEAIQAVSILIRQGHRVTLSIFGKTTDHPDYYGECQKAVESLGIEKYVVFKGHAPLLAEIYPNLDILLSLSTFESFPSSIKEATASGTLVVASQVGGIGELIKDSVNGILIAGSKPDQIAKAVIRAINLSAKENRRLRLNAYQMARQEFHPRRGLADLLSMYNLTLQIHRGRKTDEPLPTADFPFRQDQNTTPFPEGNRRSELRKITMRSFEIVTHEGFRSFFKQAWEKVKKREFKIIDSPIEPGPRK